MGKIYSAPDAEIIVLSVCDVIAASNDDAFFGDDDNL